MSGTNLALSDDAALVLFDLVHRWEHADSGLLPTLESGDRAALWELSAVLERSLSEPFQPGYSELVASARLRLAVANDG
jgi:hypothetical protein